MTYTFKLFKPELDVAQEKTVEMVYNWERDLWEHQQNLARYQELLEDANFTGRTFPDGTTFRDKIEREIPVIEWAIEECLKLITVAEKDLPKVTKRQAIVAKIEWAVAVETLPTK